jgi:hypothetical protein
MPRHVPVAEVKGNRAFGLGKGHKTQTMKAPRISQRKGVSLPLTSPHPSAPLLSLHPPPLHSSHFPSRPRSSVARADTCQLSSARFLLPLLALEFEQFELVPPHSHTRTPPQPLLLSTLDARRFAAHALLSHHTPSAREQACGLRPVSGARGCGLRSLREEVH